MLNVLKKIFFTTVDLNVALRFIYVPTVDNLTDSPSRRLSYSDSRLSLDIWHIVQRGIYGRLPFMVEPLFNCFAVFVVSFPAYRYVN